MIQFAQVFFQIKTPRNCSEVLFCFFKVLRYKKCSKYSSIRLQCLMFKTDILKVTSFQSVTPCARARTHTASLCTAADLRLRLQKKLFSGETNKCNLCSRARCHVSSRKEFRAVPIGEEDGVGGLGWFISVHRAVPDVKQRICFFFLFSFFFFHVDIVVDAV